MKTKTKTSILALSVALAGGFGAGGAMAQTASPTPPAEPQAATVDDIVVTANRRSQNLQDVPMAINAIGGEALENKGIVDTASLSARAEPSGEFAVRQDPAELQPARRFGRQ